MANRIFYNPQGYVEVIIEGEQTYMTFENLKVDAIDILDGLQKKGKRRLGLLDISKQKNYTPDTNKAAMEILESINYEKIAVFGAGKFLAEITKAIILAMGKSANTKIFADRDSAVAWLLEKLD
ncbi:MAG TPA: STAS/SEC14 domain-containing protein [Candidatus Saccharimonadales bacterium]|nr:STAS/SEC14 domain-containing protein [Candidatus Saccharimonadales bacterium]